MSQTTDSAAIQLGPLGSAINSLGILPSSRLAVHPLQPSPNRADQWGSVHHNSGRCVQACFIFNVLFPKQKTLLIAGPILKVLVYATVSDETSPLSPACSTCSCGCRGKQVT